MDGYSVTEAASVLGVPTERVWELLARGVLSGTPEGETGMRVFLQPRPKPTPADDPRRPNGDRVGAEPERELSPFRELLTEFRGLTERYGQALLALGEARGEVAALRSRVDVLEARMDLRLPMGSQPSAPWPLPMPEAPRAAAPIEHVAVSPEQPAPEPPSPEPEHPDEEEHRARSRGPRRATDSFAEALARAEDPSAPELPPAVAPGEPHTGPRSGDAGDAAEHGLPRELPPADTVPVAAEPEPEPAVEPIAAMEVAAEPEPEAAAEPEPEAAVEPIAAMEVAVEDSIALEVEPEPVAVEALGPEPEQVDGEPPAAEAEALEETTGEEQVPVATEPQPIAAEQAPEPVAEPAATVADEAEPGQPGAESEGIEFDTARYTTAIEEPDWFEAEADEPAAHSVWHEPAGALEPEIAPEPEPIAEEPHFESEPDLAPPPEPQAEPDEEAVPEVAPEPEPEQFAAEEPEPEPESNAAKLAPESEPEPESQGGEPEEAPELEPVAAAAPEEPTPPREATAADEETMLWFGQRPAADAGADEMEVAGGGAPPPQDPAEAPEPDMLPGSQELDEALASLEELTRRTRQSAPDAPDEWPPASARLPSSGASSWAMPARAPFPGGVRPGSPATRAYRRLRRIFPR